MTQRALIVVPRKVFKPKRINTLSVSIPRYILDFTEISPHEELFCWSEGDKVAFSTEGKEGVLMQRVKLRAVSRYKDREYYMLTIPMRFARELGIKKGDYVLLAIGKRHLYVMKYLREKIELLE